MQLDETAIPNAGAVRGFPGVGVDGEPVRAEAQRFEFRGGEFEAVPYRHVRFAKDAGWKVVASLPDGRPAVAFREAGRGRVWYVGVRFPAPGDEARLVASLAADRGIVPVCETLDEVGRAPLSGIEVQAARDREGTAGFVIANRTPAARAVRFTPRGAFAKAASCLLDVSRGTLLRPDADGAYLLLLEPDRPAVLRGVALKSGIPVETFAETLARMPDWLAAHAPKTAARAFSADPARVLFLDLREVANRSMLDRVAGDGEGGWTDQGENCLRNAPWGVVDCNGVPFDFIRPDQNGDRACVILRSTRQPYLPAAVRGIRVDSRAETLYFLHTGAWLGPGEAFRYVVRYSDGTAAVLPMVGKRDFGDWWIDRRGGVPATARYRTGWANSESRGFQILRWDNPSPQKTVATIDIESAESGTIPIVAAITAERPDESPWALWRLRRADWGGVRSERRDGGIELALDDRTSDWAGTSLKLPAPIPLGAAPAALDLVFEVNGGRTPLGARDTGGQTFQVAVNGIGADGAATKRLGYVIAKVDGGVDADPDTWQTVRIPLRRLVDENAVSLEAVTIQYRILPARRAGLIVRSFRIEPTEGS